MSKDVETAAVMDVDGDFEDVGEDQGPETLSTKLRRFAWILIKVLAVLGLVAYTIAAWAIDFQRAKPLLYYWLFIAFVVCYKLVFKFYGEAVNKGLTNISDTVSRLHENRIVPIVEGIVTIGIIALVIGLTIDDASRLISLAGIVVIVLLTWLISWKPTKVIWRPVFGGLLFQFVFAFLILRTDAGFNFFDFLGAQFTNLLDYVKAGSGFVFGWMVNPLDYAYINPATGVAVPGSLFPVFAVNVLPTVIFFSAFVSVLYYIGILQVLVRVIGRFLAILLGTSASESLSAAGNIFVGQTEAPLLIRPFLKDMTESEIHAVMTGGFATIAGGVLGYFIFIGISASHLLAASVMSAPAALAISKLTFPETEISKTRAGEKFEIESPPYVNAIAAAADGAMVAVQLALNIAGQLIAFLALVAMLNNWLGYFGSFIDQDDLSFEKLCGWIFYPFAFLMGVEGKDCETIATLLGVKIFTNEFVAFERLAGVIAVGGISRRSEIIATYALCGFANFGSIGIQIGGLTPLAPERTKSITKLVFSAMIAGNTACFLTACVAGLLYDDARA